MNNPRQEYSADTGESLQTDTVEIRGENPDLPANASVQAQADTLSANNAMNAGVNLVMDVPVTVTMELGRTSMLIRDILGLAPGSIVELNKPVNDPLDIYVNGTLVAHGEAVRVGDTYGVRLTAVVNTTSNVV